MCSISRIYKRFLFVLSIVMGMVLEGNSTLSLTGFLAEEQIDLEFKKGKYQYVSTYLRQNRAAYEQEREGPVQARFLLYLVGDNSPMFPEDASREQRLTQSFLQFLPKGHERGFPMDLLRAFWHLKDPLGPMATGPVFPNDYDSFFSPHNSVTRNPEEGALILLRKAAKNDRHAQYWLGHWWLFNRQSLGRLVSRLIDEGDSLSFELIAQWAGRGAVSGLALKKHRQATAEENTFHQKVSRENQSDWQEGCGGWGCCPGNRLCPEKSGDGCDLRRFDPRACCGIGGFRNNDEWECNCCLFGCYTTWSSKEAWSHGKDCGRKTVFLCRQGSQYGGTCLNAAGAAISVTGLSIPDLTTVIVGVVITGVGTGCQICGAALPDTENERREEQKLQRLKGYVQEVQDIISHEPLSELPSAEPSAFPTAYPSHAPSVGGITPTLPPSEERERHHSAPSERESRNERGWIRRSIKSLRQGLKNISHAEPDPPSLISASEAAALVHLSRNGGSDVITTQPHPDPPPILVQESELGAESAVQSRSHLVPPPSKVSIVPPSRRPPFEDQDGDGEDYQDGDGRV